MKATVNRLAERSGRRIFEILTGASPARAHPRGQRGFTLVELLAVMAIIGILAGVVAGAVSGLGTTGTNAQIASDTKTIETAADRFFSESFPQTYPVEPLPQDQSNPDLGVRIIDFDARLPQDPTKTFAPDFVKDIPNSAALVSYRIVDATGNVFTAADGADFAPPAKSRLDVSQTNKENSKPIENNEPKSGPQITDVTFKLTMTKNRAAVEILKIQIPAGYNIGGQSLPADVTVGRLQITFDGDNPWKSGNVLTVTKDLVTTGVTNEWKVVVQYADVADNGGSVLGVLLEPDSSPTAGPTLTHTISIREGSSETPGSLTLTIARPVADVVAHNRATEIWELTIFDNPTSGVDTNLKLVTNPDVVAVYRWLAVEHSTIQVEDVFDPVAGKQGIVIKDTTS